MKRKSHDMWHLDASSLLSMTGISALAVLALSSCADDPGTAPPEGTGPTSEVPAQSGGAADEPGPVGPEEQAVSLELADSGPLDEAETSVDGGDVAGESAALYLPDNGPTHEGGRIVTVASETEMLEAIGSARAGDVITISPGTYEFDQLIQMRSSGEASARIFLRAEERDSVTINLSHIENFKISGKYWIIENIKFAGVCRSGGGCEHAFHIAADADDVIFRSNEVVNFASHVKLNGEVVGAGPAKRFPDRIKFIGNFWHNTRYITNEAPHNILNLDGGRDHVVRGNIFADYNTPASLPRSASAVYAKASTLRILIEQNLVVCEKERTTGETTRGIQLGDGAPASICDGDQDQDGLGDCVENGQSQESVVRNNVIMNCDNGGSAAGIMVGSDRNSKLSHNTVYGAGQRSAGFHIGHADFDTYWSNSILENGISTDYAVRPLNETDNIMPSLGEMNAFFASPVEGDFSLVQGEQIVSRASRDGDVRHDFCGYPRGETADLGAIEYSTTHPGARCATRIKEMFDRIP